MASFLSGIFFSASFFINFNHHHLQRFSANFNAENGQIIEGVGSPDYSQFKPFFQGLFDEVVMSLWDFELLPVYRVLVFQVDFMFVISGQSQVILVDADGLLVSVEEVQIFCLEFIRYLEMASSGDVLLV